MIEDSAIKAPKSPFAMRENEIKVFDGKEGFASINQVVFKMDMGYINEYHIKALEVVNEFGFITSRQVTQILEVTFVFIFAVIRCLLSKLSSLKLSDL